MTNRQKKINALIRQDLAEILNLFLRKENIQNIIVSVTAVRVTPDLHFAKIYLSVFRFSEANHILGLMEENRGTIKNRLAGRIRNQLRIVPELSFFIDDSLQKIEKIDRSLQNPENPLKL